MTWCHMSLPSLTPLLPPPCSHRQAEAAATLGAPEFTKGLLDGARGVETLSQQQDTIEEEKWCKAIDHVLEVFDTGMVTGRSQVKQQNQLILEKSKIKNKKSQCREFNEASLTRRPWPQSPEHCGRSMSPPGLRFGSTLRAHSHKIMPCQHSTAMWPPGMGRALPQCTGYSNHNNLRGHNISAHRRHTPHI